MVQGASSQPAALRTAGPAVLVLVVDGRGRRESAAFQQISGSLLQGVPKKMSTYLEKREYIRMSGNSWTEAAVHCSRGQVGTAECPDLVPQVETYGGHPCVAAVEKETTLEVALMLRWLSLRLRIGEPFKHQL